jgi:hypothetical protein
MDLLSELEKNGVIDRALSLQLQKELGKPGAQPESVLVKANVPLKEILKVKGTYFGVPTREVGDKPIPFDVLPRRRPRPLPPTRPLPRSWQRCCATPLSSAHPTSISSPWSTRRACAFRIDGVLSSPTSRCRQGAQPVVARIKVLSNMRLDEKRKPQDGRFSARVGGVKVDFRVSTFPTYYGEKVVMRILGTTAKSWKLDELGLPKRNLELIRAAIKKPYGLILIRAPPARVSRRRSIRS